MSGLTEARENEVTFCADVKSWVDALFQQHPDWPFERAHIEKYGRGTNKRHDFRVLAREGLRPVLSGEVKMPGTTEGRSPYDPALMQDAFLKAKNIQAPYFFTWNVNKFVLFDSSRWNVPLIEMRLRDWDLGLHLTNSGDCLRAEVRAYIRDKFLPELFSDLARIVAGTFVDWGMAPDDIFLRSLESHLDWPVLGTRDYLAEQCRTDRAFSHRLWEWMAREMQWTFDPDDPEIWRQALDRAARTLCYVFSNRAIFYKAIQARYPQMLRSLTMPRGGRDHHAAYEHFRRQFQAAVDASGDYEPVFYPQVSDWVGATVFASPQARLGWKGFFVNLETYDFRAIPHDIIGGVFKKLIAPEERQKFGQFFTHQDIVDVINAFCIRKASDVVLDPACGSGSFLVRAYHRKAWLSEQRAGGTRRHDRHKTHQELLREILGCDIAVFPAHLATLNLAAREIQDEENYPLIRRGNFFEVVEKPAEFYRIPGPRTAAGRQPAVAVPLPALDAVVGNPPYVRQELIPRRSQTKRAKGEPTDVYEARLKNTKEHLQDLVSAAWPDLKLSGRSDLHCYFWPVASKLLKEGGYFGFLTSSSWLDVEYGFALQGWILQNFKLLAVLESVDEPWFEDARIKTVVAVMQRCDDKAARDANIVKFVRLQKPLAEILGERAHGNEGARQFAAQNLRIRIEMAEFPCGDEQLRIIPIPQSRLWEEGVKAGSLLAKSALARPTGDDDDETESDEEDGPDEAAVMEAIRTNHGHYAAGKWGRFLRAPDIYFRIMQQYGQRFVKLGEIAEIRFGIKSGCDAFFMPRDVTGEILAEVEKGFAWNQVGLMTPCRLNEVQSGRVRIVRAGNNTLHPIEAEFLRPEVHSLMQVGRPLVGAADTNRVVLWVSKELKELSGTYVAKYIRWGNKETFASKKSKPVPVPKRSTCASRPVWYDLTSVSTGIVFWPMAQQYRHVIPANPENLVCNHNLFYVSGRDLNATEHAVLSAVLNCTLLALFKTYYGRYAGTEGNLKTEVVDVNLLDVPDVRGVSEPVARRLLAAFESMQARQTGPLVEEDFMRCHGSEHVKELAMRPVGLPDELRQADRRELDDAVLEMLGVVSPEERGRILDELYLETARHYRQVRIVEVQKQEQRGGGQRRLSAEDVAAGVWDSLADDEKGPPLTAWLGSLNCRRQMVMIPDGLARPLGNGHLYSPAGVDFVQGKTIHHEDYAGVEQAALIAYLANLDIRGEVEVPSDEAGCRQWRQAVETRLDAARSRLDTLTGSRTGSENLREASADLLMQWFIHGRG